jgi:hypothetical protein
MAPFSLLMMIARTARPCRLEHRPLPQVPIHHHSFDHNSYLHRFKCYVELMTMAKSASNAT